MYIGAVLTPYIEDAQQFNGQLGDLLRRALDTSEAIAAERRRIDELADQQLARGPAASTPPAERRVLPSGTPVRITRPGQFTAVYLHLHGGGWIIGPARAADLPNARIAATCGVAIVSQRRPPPRARTAAQNTKSGSHRCLIQVRRLSEALPVYAAPDQDVCGVDM